MESLKQARRNFLNYLEGTLSDDEKAKFEAALHESEELQTELDNYRRIVQMEQEVSKQHEEEFQLDERFVSKVMAEVRNPQPGFIRNLLMKLDLTTKQMSYGFGGFAVATLCVALLYTPAYQQVKLGGNSTVEEVTSEHDLLVKTGDQPELLLNENEGDKADKTAEIMERLTKQIADESPKELRQQSRRRALPAPATAPESFKPLVKKQKSERFSGISVQDLVAGSAPSGAKGLTGRVRVDGEEYGVGKDGRLRQQAIPGARSEMVAVEPSVTDREILLSNQTKRIIYHPHLRPNTEHYGEFEENVPVLTSTEPMSTFSIDVDTGSYTNARRFLQSGNFPPSNSVRVEEFINYFDYNYPTQSREPFAANFEIAPSLDSDGTHLLKIGIKAKESGFDGKEKPWNLVFLIDVSGSMQSANKLNLVQSSLELLTKKMRAGDKVSIVTYAGSSGLLLPPTGIENRAKILSAIQGLRSGGGTHGSAGIMQAYQAAQDAFIKDGVNRVILATDGDFNVGIVNRTELIKLIEEKRKSGITLTTLGFGTGNYNEAMMEQLANKGNGNYFYIDSFREARKVFEDDLYGTIEVVAKDVKLQIEFNPEHVAQYRLVGYENRKLRNQDFANDKIDAGEIGAGHTVTALYEVVLTDSEVAKNLSAQYRYKKEEKIVKKPQSEFASELAFLKIRYKAPQGSKSKLLTFPLKRSSVKSEFKKATQDFQFVAAVSAFAHKLRSSQYGPEVTFEEIISAAKSAKGSDEKGYRQEFIELVKNAASKGSKQ